MSVEPRVRSRIRRAARGAGISALVLVLFSLLLELPTAVYDVGHDLGSHAAFAYFVEKRLQFGVDIIENGGPLAFAHHSGTYSGQLTLVAAGLKMAMRFALAALIAYFLAQPIGWLARLVWIGLIAAPSVVTGSDHAAILDTTDVSSLLAVYLGAAVLLHKARSGPRNSLVDLALALVLVVIALTKHTMLAMVGVTAVVVIVTRLARGERLGSARFTAFLIASSALVWQASGQHLANIPAFLRAVFAFTSGYNEALGLETHLRMEIVGALLVLFAVALCWWNVARKRCSAALAIVATMMLLLTWKQGMVRADSGHVLMLFASLSQMLPAIAWASDDPARRAAAQSNRPTHRVLAMATVMGLAGPWVVGATWCVGPLYVDPRLLLVAWPAQASWLIDPHARIAELEAKLDENRKRYALPAIQQQVVTASIDQFGFEQGHLLLNRLDYAPRPIPISVAAVTGELSRRNEAFYRGPRAPAFVLAHLARLSSIDHHLVSQRDGLALAALFDDYHPVAVENGRVLLQRNPPAARRATADWELLAEYEIQLGQSVRVPGDDATYVYASIEVRPRWTGRVRAIFLRAPVMGMRLRIPDGPLQIRRINVSDPDLRFLVRPLIEDDEALLAAYRGGALLEPDRIFVAAMPGMERYFESAARIRFYRGPAPPRAPQTSEGPAGRRSGP